MFQQLDLKNFRQHTELTIDFQQGVVALRGRNEAGKTTVLEAMAYAMFGATALREGLEDVVTWGKKPGDLKVKLDFHLNGIDYRIYRSKSGAEIRTADKVLATGQKEVTGYVETLLGADKDTCTRLMLASQEDIKGALSKGPAAAIELIESLSNLGVIDTIVGLVQTQLPCGSTVSVTSRLTMLEQQAAVPVEDDTGPLQQTYNSATLEQAKKQHVFDDAKKVYDSYLTPANAAQAAVDAHQRLLEEDARASSNYERAKVALHGAVVPKCPSDAEIELLRKRAGDAGYMKRAIAAAEVLGGWQESADPYGGTVAECTAQKARHVTTRDAHTALMNRLNVDIARQESQKITQTACGLCGKDLSDVPEVVTKNGEIDRLVVQMREQVQYLQEQFITENGHVARYDTLLSLDAANRRLHAKAAEFGKLVETTVPCAVEWTGPEELTEVEGNPALDLTTAEAAVRAHHAAVGRQQQLRAAAETANETLLDVRRKIALAEADLADHQTVLEQAAAELQVLNAAETDLRNAQEAVRIAQQALAVAQAGLRERQAARTRLEAQLADARKELAEMEDNNALIDFLRKARPKITDQLWGMVMDTVSSYFSAIRGTQSAVTRADNGFKVDGHNIGGLSGSTKDALGLAIRKALTKTFLPNASFMMLDEPASGCDEDREANMLGLIAGGGFEQVILITHSDLADSFATQVVQL